MLHKLNTAEKSYVLYEKSDSTVQWTDVLWQNINSFIKQIPSPSSTTIIESSDSPTVEAVEEESAVPVVEPYTKNKKWSDENKEFIREKFPELIIVQSTPMAKLRAILKLCQWE